MENLKFYKIAIAVLLLLNVGTLVFLWSHRPPSPEGRGPFQFLVNATGMDETQQTTYRTLRDAHRESMQAFRKQNSQIRGQMFELLKQHPANDPAVTQLLDSLAAVKREEEILTYEHFRQVRSICRPDQQMKFDAAIVEAIQSMGPPGPRK
jgi:Spy/CpxP family protein refolding chaperone